MSLHKCPVPNCPRFVGAHLLMCRAHWQMVPAEEGRTLYREFKAGPRSKAHVEAMRACIDAVGKTLAARA